MQAVFAISPFSVQFYLILERFTPILFCLPLFPQESLEPNGANELWGLIERIEFFTYTSSSFEPIIFCSPKKSHIPCHFCSFF